VHRYRLRSAVAVSTCATAPVALFLTCLVLSGLVGLLWLGAAVGFFAAAAVFTLNYRRVRRRTLTVKPEGLEVQRDQYRLLVPWTAINGVQHRRHQRVMAVEELVVTGADVVPLDNRDQSTSLPQQLLAGHPAPTRVMVSLYDKDWREGPIGDRLRNIGVLPTA
jgi:hypothetical protein